eukprot:TRINITY_DN11346_c0_g2_i4.p1 TRINITY_DN11346_c0_g2~~TRINITY_DN11346_c0_g2_i4.p1  ORF type:complete len:238 (+),score=48.68 TRINITY_DN11346_c0_g2_i4:59-715(+)
MCIRDRNDKVTKFYLYMHFSNTSKKDNEDPSVAILRLFPMTGISQPKVDADQNIVYPVLKGNVSKGGSVDNYKSTLFLEYNCIAGKDGESWVELTIPLDYFNDIDLRFMKVCGRGVAMKSRAHTFLWWIFIIAFLGLLYVVFNNYVFKNKAGLDALPGIDRIRELIKKTPLKNWLGRINYQEIRSTRATRNEDDEAEFKIDDLNDTNEPQQKSDYGSI